MRGGLLRGFAGGSSAGFGAPVAEEELLPTSAPRPVGQPRRQTSPTSRLHAPTKRIAGPGRIGTRDIARPGGGVSRVSRRASSNRSLATPRGISWAAVGSGSRPNAIPVPAKAASNSATRCPLPSKRMRMLVYTGPSSALRGPAAASTTSRESQELGDAVHEISWP